MNIKADNLTIHYDGSQLFEPLSFEAVSGQNICIAGPSGSGKTTVLKALMGLVPACGEIFVGQELLSEKTAWHLRHKIAYVAQEADLGQGVVIDRMQRPFSYHANAHLTWDRAKVADYCRQFRLDETILAKNLADISGGQKQRIAIIIALLLARPILLLDEPLSALDKETKQIVKEQLKADTSRTIFFISHDPSLLDIADSTIELNPLEVSR